VLPLDEDGGVLPWACALEAEICRAITYMPGATRVDTPVEEVVRVGRGVCQDMAHLFITCLRALGLPARYISGYLYTGDEETPQVASHAWAAVWIDALGWVSFDLANKTCGTERHIGLAMGLDYASSAPLRGVREGGSDTEVMDVQVMVTLAGNVQ
jgi:transglutaminase-like putative cysteine protease